jgi:hypothetical protein
MPPIYLFQDDFRIFTAASKRRPGPVVQKALRAKLDPAGLKLLDHVLAEQFDLPDIAALEREHLLSLTWGAWMDRHPDLQTCVAEYHPRAAQLFCSDVSRLLLWLARAHAAKSDTAGLSSLADQELQLDQLTHDLAEDEFRPLYHQLNRTRPPPFSSPTASGLCGYMLRTLVYTVCAWHRPLGPMPVKRLSGDVRVVALDLEWGFECVGKAHKAQARAWAYARLRERLEGNAGPLTVPPGLLP